MLQPSEAQEFQANESHSESHPRQNHIPVTMRAVVYKDYGDASVLTPTHVNTPTPNDRQLLIRVSHASINPIDYRVRKGEMRHLLIGGFPRIPGFDIAGEVVSSPAPNEFRPGDRVMAYLDSIYGGGYAEYAVCSPKVVAKIPDSMSFAEAAAIPLAATTAVQCLREIGKIKPGSRVLINGASGGVGTFAVQIACSFGAHVTAVASGSKEQYVRDLGANEFIDYHKQSFEDMHRKWDIVFDVAGKSSYQASRKVLSAQGVYVSTEPSLKSIATSLLTLALPKKGRAMLARPDAAVLRLLVRLYEEKKLRVVIDQTLPLEQAAQAHRVLENGVDKGKVVLSMAQTSE